MTKLKLLRFLLCSLYSLLPLLEYLDAQSCTNASVETEIVYSGLVEITVGTALQVTSLSNILKRAEKGTVVNVEWIGVVITTSTLEVTNGMSLNISGSSPQASKIDGEMNHQIFSVKDESTLSLSNISLVGGSGLGKYFATSGGAIQLGENSNLVARDCVFDNNEAANGGAIYSVGSDVLIGGGTIFSNNRADGFFGGGGGAISMRKALFSSEDISIVLEDTVLFQRNSASSEGGALEIKNGNFVVGGKAYFVGNTAEIRGGAILLDDSTMEVDGELFLSENTATRGGGAVYMYEAHMTIGGNLSCYNNTAEMVGGAVQIGRGSISIVGYARFYYNIAGDGGALYSYRLLGTNKITFAGVWDMRHNSANPGSGGAVHIRGTDVEINGKTRFTQNRASQYGGAVFAGNGVNVVINATAFFSGNTAQEGHATYAKSDAILMINGKEYGGVNDIQGYTSALEDDDGGDNDLTGDDDARGVDGIGGNDTNNGGDEETVGEGDDDERETVNAGGFLAICFNRSLSILLLAQIWVMAH